MVATYVVIYDMYSWSLLAVKVILLALIIGKRDYINAERIH